MKNIYYENMRKVLIFQHVAHEILGTLNPLLKQQGMRIRYVNFDRSPNERPSIDKYDGLVVLGGHMGVYEAEKYLHIKVEMQLIEQALKKGIPILGVCLGAQILAHVLGAEVRRSPEKEIGWHQIHLTEEGMKDPLFSHFQKSEKIFQLHGDTFDIPKAAKHLAWSEACQGQAFRVGENVYGLQFHLEVDPQMISRWLSHPNNQREILDSKGKFSVETIRSETTTHIAHSMDLSRQTFSQFIDLFHLPERPELLGSGHGKSHKESK